MSTSELACTYAALALFDDDLEVNAENIQKLLKSANVKVETYWPALFESLVKERGIATLITAAACKGTKGSEGAAVIEAGAGEDGDKQEEDTKESEEEEEPSSSKPGGLLYGSSTDSDSSDYSDGIPWMARKTWKELNPLPNKATEKIYDYIPIKIDYNQILTIYKQRNTTSNDKTICMSILNITENKWKSVSINKESCKLINEQMSRWGDISKNWRVIYDKNKRMLYIFTYKCQSEESIHKSFQIDINNMNNLAIKESSIVSPETANLFYYNDNIHSFGGEIPCKHLILNHDTNEFELFSSLSDHYGDNPLLSPCIVGFHKKNSMLIIGGQVSYEPLSKRFNAIYEINLSDEEKKYTKWNVKLPPCERQFCCVITNDDKYLILFAGIYRRYAMVHGGDGYYQSPNTNIYILRIGIDETFLRHPSVQSPFGGVCEVFINNNKDEAKLLLDGYIRRNYEGNNIFPMSLIDQISDWIMVEEIILSKKDKWRHPNLWKCNLYDILKGVNFET